MKTLSFLNPFLMLASAPLFLGVVNRTKAFFAGRKGQPLLQFYYDFWKLLKKGAVYGRTTTWVFRAGPVIGLSCLVMASVLIPMGGWTSPVHFEGDLILFAYLLGLARFFTISAALDTGSSFEGMGASREAWFSALAEPALLVALAALVRLTGQISLSSIFQAIHFRTWETQGMVLALVLAALILVFLAENARIPVDDPNTHLELTMIHEVMALDHGGPDLGFILYAASLKFSILGSLIVGLVFPVHTDNAGLGLVVFLGGMLILAVGVGVVESLMARLRLVRIPQMLVGAGALSVVAFILEMNA